MDPLSITISVAGLISASAKIITSLKGFADAAQTVGNRVQLMIAEVNLFEGVLQSMRSTLEADCVQQLFYSSGDLLDHWRNIAICLEDGSKMLGDLHETLAKVDKSVNLLDSARRTLRLKASWDDIEAFQMRCRSCREAISISMQAIMLWNQATASTPVQADAPDLVVLTRSIKRLAKIVNCQLSVLETESDDEEYKVHELAGLRNLKACVESSAKVVSSASSRWTDDESLTAGSDFARLFPHEPNDHTLAWIKETAPLKHGAVSEKNAPPPSHYLNAAVPTPTVSADVDDSDSDSDGEIEVHIGTEQVRRGREAALSGIIDIAERHYSRGTARLRRYQSRLPDKLLQIRALTELSEIYQHQMKWDNAKNAIIEKLGVLSQTATTTSTDVLHAKLDLARVLIHLDDTVEAKLHVKTCIKAYLKLGDPGKAWLETSLGVMVDICKRDGDEDGEEGYRLLMAGTSRDRSDGNRALQTQNCEGHVHQEAAQNQGLSRSRNSFRQLRDQVSSRRFVGRSRSDRQQNATAVVQTDSLPRRFNSISGIMTRFKDIFASDGSDTKGERSFSSARPTSAEIRSHIDYELWSRLKGSTQGDEASPMRKALQLYDAPVRHELPGSIDVPGLRSAPNTLPAMSEATTLDEDDVSEASDAERTSQDLMALSVRNMDYSPSEPDAVGQQIFELEGSFHAPLKDVLEGIRRQSEDNPEPTHHRSRYDSSFPGRNGDGVVGILGRSPSMRVGSFALDPGYEGDISLSQLVFEILFLQGNSCNRNDVE